MGGSSSKCCHGSPQKVKKATTLKFKAIKDRFNSLEEVQAALRGNGLESSQLIVGIDFTKSNEWTGKHSFRGMSLHHIGQHSNPYEQAFSVIARTLAPFDDDNLIPAYGFGDASTHDSHVFSFLPGSQPCQGLEQVLWRYRSIAPLVKLAGPTSFAPLIHQAIRDTVASGMQYHILLLLADGQVTRSIDMGPGEYSLQERATIDAIVAASYFPLSIVMVGLGDGPFDTMCEFDDALPSRRFDNFQFVDFSQLMREAHGLTKSKTEALFALRALMEVPDQYRAILQLGLIGGTPTTAVPPAWLGPPALGPPPSVLAADRQPPGSMASSPPDPGFGSFDSAAHVPHSQAFAIPDPPLHMREFPAAVAGSLRRTAATSSREDLIEERLCQQLHQEQVASSTYPTLTFNGGHSVPPPSAYASPSVAPPADRPIGQDGSSHHGRSLGSSEPNPMFLCPITQEVMKAPVMAGDGYTYEQLAIESWLSNHATSPITNAPLPHKHLIANHSLRSAIMEWQHHHASSA